MVAAADYQNPITKNMVEKIFLSFRREERLGDYQKLIGNGDLLSYYLANKRSLHVRSQGL